MIQFRKYNSIENSYREEFIDQLMESFGEEEFVVQEKVHGANLSFWCDGQTIKCAKRTEFIKADDSFYRFNNVLKKYEKAIYKLFEIVKKERPELKVLTVFGELFGGGYPHPEIDRDKESVAIQKGIFYCPSSDFYAFDIMLNNESYLTVDQVNKLFEQCEFFYARTLFKGTLSEALKYENSFESKISAWLNLPSIEHNICEGVVIKPVIPHFLHNGSRVIIKNKNEKWEESKRYNKLQLDQDKISETAEKLAEEVLNYVTANRLNNVISKIGEVTQKDFGRLVGMLSKDVLEDFDKDYHSELEALEKKEQKLIKKSLSNSAGKLVKEFFEN